MKVNGKVWCYLDAPTLLDLESQTSQLRRAFDPYPLLLVGSCLSSPEFNDVDLRVIMDDADFDRIFGPAKEHHNSELWCCVCLAISKQLSANTGLKIDFQVHKRSNVRSGDIDKDFYVLGAQSSWNRDLDTPTEDGGVDPPPPRMDRPLRCGPDTGTAR